jgi:hypothetical protein
VDILEIEDVLKGLPDQALRQEAQQPSGQVPQYMVVSEIQRRSKMRKRFEAQQEQPSTTVAEQILTGGVASVAPPPPQMMGAMGMPQQPPAPPQQPPMGQQQPPMQPQQMPPQQPPMPQQGAPMPPPVQMQEGGQTPYSNPQGLIIQALEEGVPGSVLVQQAPQFADLINRLEAQMLTKMGVDQYENIKQDYIPYGREFDSDLASAPAGPMEEVVVTADRLPPLEPQGIVETPRSSGVLEPLSTSFQRFDTGIDNLFGVTQPTVRREKPVEFPPLGPVKEMPRRGDVTASDLYGDQEIQKGAKAFRESFSDMAQASLDEAAPNRQFIADLLSGKFAYEPESVARAKRGESLFPPTQQTATAQPQLSVPEDPFGMLRSDAVGFEPLRSQQNILQETISNIADQPILVGDQPVVTNVASSSAIASDTQTGAGASDSTGTKVTRETIEAATSDVTPEFKVGQDIAKDFSDLVAPSFAGLISEQERRLAKIREDAKRDVGAQALINLGAGVMEGDVAGGLRKAGQAASKVRAAERAAESDIANMQARIKMAEEQGKFDVAKALRAEQVQLYRDATKAAESESQFVRTLGLSKQRLLAEVEKEAGVDARARLAAAITIMEETLDPKEKERLTRQIALEYLPIIRKDVPPANQGGVDTSGFRVLSTE